jgi:hypothetical protein
MLLRLPKEVTYKGLGQRKYIQLFIYNVKVAFLKALTESGVLSTLAFVMFTSVGKNIKRPAMVLWMKKEEEKLEARADGGGSSSSSSNHSATTANPAETADVEPNKPMVWLDNDSIALRFMQQYKDHPDLKKIVGNAMEKLRDRLQNYLPDICNWKGVLVSKLKSLLRRRLSSKVSEDEEEVSDDENREEDDTPTNHDHEDNGGEDPKDDKEDDSEVSLILYN